MTRRQRRLWGQLRGNLRHRLISGAVLLMPFGVALLVARWLFQWLAAFLGPVVQRVLVLLNSHPVTRAVPAAWVTVLAATLSIVLLLAILYGVGTVGRMVLGRRLIAAGETLVLRIPLIRTIYSATKQVAQAVSLPNGAAFQSVVLVEFPRPGLYALGFLTGHLHDAAGRRLATVFIPTTPNPTTGFLEILPADQVAETGMAVEEAFKMIISGGILSPERLELRVAGPGEGPRRPEPAPREPPQPGPRDLAARR